MLLFCCFYPCHVVRSVSELSKMGPSGHLGLQGLQVVITPLPIFALKVVGQETKIDGVHCLMVRQVKFDRAGYKFTCIFFTLGNHLNQELVGLATTGLIHHGTEETGASLIWECSWESFHLPTLAHWVRRWENKAAEQTISVIFWEPPAGYKPLKVR